LEAVVVRRPSGDRPGASNGTVEGQQQRLARAVTDEQSVADSEQTLAEADQTLSDADQTGSESDQTSADSDQVASDREAAARERRALAEREAFTSALAASETGA